MANPTIWTKRGVIIGVHGLVFAKLTKDDASGTTYETTVYRMPGVQEIAITFSITEEVLPADDIPVYEIFNMLDSMEVSITVASLGRDGEAFLLGHRVDTKGGVLTNQTDEAPYVAMGFESSRSDGSVDMAWLYKGKFKPGDEKFRTKEKGKVNWQTPLLTGTFGARISDGNMRYVINSKDESVVQTTLSTFFNSVYAPSFT